MKYFAICPVCGKRLCKAEEGSTVDIQCPDCKEQVEIVVTRETVSTKRNLHKEQKEAVQRLLQLKLNTALSEKSSQAEYHCQNVRQSNVC